MAAQPTPSAPAAVPVEVVQDEEDAGPRVEASERKAEDEGGAAEELHEAAAAAAAESQPNEEEKMDSSYCHVVATELATE